MLTDKSLDRLLDLTYELEGLLLLVRSRREESDAVEPRINTLIEEKIAEIAAEGILREEPDSITDELQEETSEVQPDVEPEYTPDDSREESTDIFVAEEPEEDSEEISEVEETEDKEVETADVKTEEIKTKEFEEGSIEDETIGDEDIEDEDIEDEEQSFEIYDLDDEDDEVSMTESKTADAPVVSVPVSGPACATVASATARQGAPVFSINDRFLFARELFGGRTADFEQALKEVASMESYEEAEEYFTSERGFNPELPIVQDFLAVIARYF